MEVEGVHGRAAQNGCHSADDDELNLVLGEDADRTGLVSGLRHLRHTALSPSSRWSQPLDRGEPVSTRLTYRRRFQIER